MEIGAQAVQLEVNLPEGIQIGKTNVQIANNTAENIYM